MLLLVLVWSCTKTPIVERTEIEFTTAYVTPADVADRKLTTACGDTKTPYWEGKTLNLQGYTWASNIDSVGKSFFLYSKYVLADPSQLHVIIYYQSKDSAKITSLLLANKDKHCFLTVRCLTELSHFDYCGKALVFTIQKPEDIEFQ